MKDLCAPSSKSICALQQLIPERTSTMAVFKMQVVLPGSMFVSGNLDGTESVREASDEDLLSGEGADSCLVCLSLSVVVSHKLEWCFPLQCLHQTVKTKIGFPNYFHSFLWVGDSIASKRGMIRRITVCTAYQLRWLRPLLRLTSSCEECHG